MRWENTVFLPMRADCGSTIITDPNMVDTIEDWSCVRSPGRARRRRRRGFRQNVKITKVPKKEIYSIDNGAKLIMHPEMYRELKKHIADQVSNRLEDMTVNAILGRDIYGRH